jgi:hypothetical protein
MCHIYGQDGEGLDSPTPEESLLACMELSSLTLHPPTYLASPQRWIPSLPPLLVHKLLETAYVCKMFNVGRQAYM